VLYVVDSDVVNAYSGDEFVDGSEGASETLEERGRGARRGGLARRGRGRRRGDRAGVRRPHEEILGYINDEDIDLTVMGSKTRSGELPADARLVRQTRNLPTVDRASEHREDDGFGVSNDGRRFPTGGCPSTAF